MIFSLKLTLFYDDIDVSASRFKTSTDTRHWFLREVAANEYEARNSMNNIDKT